MKKLNIPLLVFHHCILVIPEIAENKIMCVCVCAMSSLDVVVHYVFGCFSVHVHTYIICILTPYTLCAQVCVCVGERASVHAHSNTHT